MSDNKTSQVQDTQAAWKKMVDDQFARKASPAAISL